MTVKEFIKMEVETDVYDNVTEELAIAFCGPLELTELGAGHFSEALELEIDFTAADSWALVQCDGPGWEDKLSAAKEFFEAAAGYCAADDYDKWFKEG